jgi:osmotically-inducible protein OsmY
VDPNLEPTDIAGAVKDGVVTLTGFVRSYSEKYEAEEAAKRVGGVVGVANDLEVRLLDVDWRPDPEIARDAVAAIKSRLPFSWQHIKVIVENGWIQLKGKLNGTTSGTMQKRRSAIWRAP